MIFRLWVVLQIISCIAELCCYQNIVDFWKSMFVRICKLSFKCQWLSQKLQNISNFIFRLFNWCSNNFKYDHLLSRFICILIYFLQSQWIESLKVDSKHCEHLLIFLNLPRLKRPLQPKDNIFNLAKTN